MAEGQAGVLVQLRKLLESHAAKELTDAQLLTRFAVGRDESAFAALIQRHSRLVYGVCRHVLGHEQDAEDAYQGTFLVLARKAATIRQQSSVAGWLHGVAYRLSLKARQTAGRRRRHENLAARIDVAPPSPEQGWRELQALLDKELQRLPEKYRTPFVLCVLEGKSKSEAARELMWKEGTVSSRLAKARTLLQVRLAKRGVTLSAVLCGLAVAEKGAQAAAPILLTANTLRAAGAFGAGQALGDGLATARAVSLADGLLKTMAASRFKHGLAVLFLLLVVGTSSAFYFWGSPETELEPPAPPAPMQANLPGAEVANPKGDPTGKMVVRGQIISPDDKPVAGAHVAILTDEVRQAGDREMSIFTRRKLVAVGRADAEGRFELSVRRPTLQQHSMYCLVRGDGQAVAWKSLQTLLDPEALKLKLEAGQQIRGRLVDAGGAPAAGVKLRVGRLIGSPGGPSSLSMDDELVTEAWPSSVVTDGDGMFVLSGLLPLCTVHVETRDERFGPQWLSLRTDNAGMADAGTLTLTAPRVLEGTVVAEDTGQPVANAQVLVSSSTQFGPGNVTVRTNEAGRFVVKPYAGAPMARKKDGSKYESVGVTVNGAPGTPFLAYYKSFEWPANWRHKTVEMKLPRGILVHGRVVEEGSGRPVPGARVQYRPMSGKNRYGHEGNLLVLWKWLDACSDADGQFQLPVVPGPGHLLVRGPGHDYVPIEVSERELIDGYKGGGRAHFPDALVPLDLKAGENPAAVEARLRRGVTVVGRALRADGEPVATGFLLSRTFRAAGWEVHSDFLPIRDGRFEISGCDPGKVLPTWFWDHKALQGAVVDISGKDQNLTVRLAPFGTASLRFIDANGEVVRKPQLYVKLVVRPGLAERESWLKGGLLRLTSYVDFQGRRDDPATGIVTLPALISDATYMVEVAGRGRYDVSATFSVPAGQHVRLDDVQVDPPP